MDDVPLNNLAEVFLIQKKIFLIFLKDRSDLKLKT